MKIHFKLQLRKLFYRFISLICLAIVISSCSLNFTSDSQFAGISETTGTFQTPEVKVTFQVQLPENLPEDEKVILELLDEVTGLPYNIHRFDLEKIGEKEFSTTLKFPQGSVLKYRYASVGDEVTPETDLAGKPIRYRLFYVTVPDTAADIIQYWCKTTSSSDTGTLKGTVIQQESKAPIADILVSAGGQLTFTDVNGRFSIHNLSPGTHNVVFYALDGHYKTYQQGAKIATDLVTSAEVALTSSPFVTVTFVVNPPNDALGVPIYLAGNLLQLGNTFTPLPGLMSIKPKRMPLLSPVEDGSYILALQLPSGADMRYKFTLGDGYWNAEQTKDGSPLVRQLIIPDHDVTINADVLTWRTADFEPITFQVNIPVDTAPEDEKYIQFKKTTWTEPLPLWPLGDGNYLYILFSPFDSSTSISYRYCRNEACEVAANASATISEAVIIPGNQAQTVRSMVDSWQNWHPQSQSADVPEAILPEKDVDYSTMIELSPLMNPTWDIYAPVGISKIAEISATDVIFTPQWYLDGSGPSINPEIGSTPFTSALKQMGNAAGDVGLDVILFPQLGPVEDFNSIWSKSAHSVAWWMEWFEEYRRFILNYAQIAAQINAESMVLGGKSILPSFSNGKYPDNSLSDVPEEIDDLWENLISDIRAIYSGKLIWATNVHQTMDPLPAFIDKFDVIYILIESPLADQETASFDTISFGFTQVIDTFIYEIYNSTQKPVILGLGYPSTSNTSQGCLILDERCYNDGLFLAQESVNLENDLDQQVLLYNAIFPILTSRDWIKGVSIRGYDPTLAIHDSTSSINGKPAMRVIEYWFEGLYGE